MKFHLFFMTVSFLSFLFSGWYVYENGKKIKLNRIFAVFSILVSSWTFLFIIFTSVADNNFINAWYRHQIYSYLPKATLVFHYTLFLTNSREKIRFPIILFYIPSLAAAAFGAADIFGLHFTDNLFQLWKQRTGTALPWKIPYSILTMGFYTAAFIQIGIWFRQTVFRREKRLAMIHLVLGVFIVGTNLTIGWLPHFYPDLEFDAILVLQLIQPFVTAYAITHYLAFKPATSIISNLVNSQISHSVVQTDRKGTILSVNSATVELTGIPAGDITGRPLKNIFQDSSSSIILSDKQPVQYAEWSYKTMGGETVPMSLSITPIFDPWKDCVGYVLIGQPVRKLMELQDEFGITKREREIYLLLIRGLTNQEIADRLFISFGTVKNHVYNIYEKTGVKNRAELARLIQ